jgi:DNA-binding NtrC family response regulator
VNIPRSLLHVDDDPQCTQLTTALLEPYGFQVTAINDPREVIQRIPKIRERVMLLDIDMPRINGLDLLKEIKAYDGGILVVMLSGIVTQTTVFQSLRLGAEACFFKPLTDVEPLADALADCFRKLDRWWHTLDELVRRRKSEQLQTDGIPDFQLSY